VGTALLLEYFNELPEFQEGDNPEAHLKRWQKALEKFEKRVAERYTEATLQRLLDSGNAATRRAAVLALGLLGTMASNHHVAAQLHDGDRAVRRLAADALWAVWFRADSMANNQELQRLVQRRDPDEMLDGLSALIRKAPHFAEAYNQRAIVYFRKKEFQKSIADCEKVVQLNPYHFGAYAGMAQCYLNLNKPRSALKAFRNALQINPNMEGVEDAIRSLENALGEEGRR
jgi:tetratricopeptide (TPR) repeat protein